jgi:hypothetical protein
VLSSIQTPLAHPSLQCAAAADQAAGLAAGPKKDKEEGERKKTKNTAGKKAIRETEQ